MKPSMIQTINNLEARGFLVHRVAKRQRYAQLVVLVELSARTVMDDGKFVTWITTDGRDTAHGHYHHYRELDVCGNRTQVFSTALCDFYSRL